MIGLTMTFIQACIFVWFRKLNLRKMLLIGMFTFFFSHMKEHMDVPIDTSNMSEQELQFHYFKMHDSDGNNKLDGCELVKSLIHWHGKIF